MTRDQDLRPAAHAGCPSRAAEAELVRVLGQRLDHERDVLVEVDPELLGALATSSRSTRPRTRAA